jgi:hypothetical protein
MVMTFCITLTREVGDHNSSPTLAAICANKNSAFATLLGMAATYALTPIVAALLAADSLARNSIVIPRLLD